MEKTITITSKLKGSKAAMKIFLLKKIEKILCLESNLRTDFLSIRIPYFF